MPGRKPFFKINNRTFHPLKPILKRGHVTVLTFHYGLLSGTHCNLLASAHLRDDLDYIHAEPFDHPDNRMLAVKPAKHRHRHHDDEERMSSFPSASKVFGEKYIVVPMRLCAPGAQLLQENGGALYIPKRGSVEEALRFVFTELGKRLKAGVGGHEIDEAVEYVMHDLKTREAYEQNVGAMREATADPHRGMEGYRRYRHS